MNQPTPIKDLIARATPGPWASNGMSCVTASNGGVLAVCYAPLSEAPYSPDKSGPTTDYIARLSPEVVLAVVEALEAALDNEEIERESVRIDDIFTGKAPQDWPEKSELQARLERALALLNATPHGGGE